MLHLYELCRLCAQKKRQKLDVFTSLTREEAKILLAKISLCVSVQVTQEDLLPKSICLDCQKTVEQINAFRIKCHKAEERLNKMLSLALPNKVIVSGIKQEHSEPDYCDTYPQLKSDAPSPCSNLKTAKIVKVEVDDIQEENNLNSVTESSELIKIISDEIVSQNQFEDVKQPQIEIISENFNGEFKFNDFNEYDQYYTCDVKLIPETLITTEEDLIELYDEPENEKDVTETKEVETIVKEAVADEIDTIKESEHKAKNRKKKKIENIEEEPDEKDLVLKEGEVCDIDLEEMSALIKKKQDPQSTFDCKKCDKSFKFFKCFKKHKQWHDEQPEVFICDFCKNDNAPNFEFSNFKSLNYHIHKKHLYSGSNKYKCDLCHKVFFSSGQLKAHMRKVHDKTEAMCQTCGKKFKNQASLNSHFRVHQEERPYVCDLCGQSFKWSNALKVHLMWHKQEKNFLCSECGKKFTAKKNLLEHLNIHSGKRPYVCEHCNASFTQLSAFSKHLYLHNENSRLHKCDKCNLTFSHAYMLKQHLLRHTNLRPFKCTTCFRSFKSQSDLCCHVKIHSEKRYCCQVCGCKFAASKTLKDHMVRHTGIKHICPVPGCGRTYTQRFSLTKHFLKQHPTFSLVKKKSGKKTHLTEDPLEKQSVDFIRYTFEAKFLT